MKIKISILYLFILLSFCGNDTTDNHVNNDVALEDNFKDITSNQPQCPPDPQMIHEQTLDRSYICLDFTPIYDEDTRYTYCKVEVLYPEGMDCPEGASLIRTEGNRKICEIPQLYGHPTGWYYLPSLGQGVCSEHGDINFPESFIPPVGSTVFICCKTEN